MCNHYFCAQEHQRCARKYDYNFSRCRVKYLVNFREALYFRCIRCVVIREQYHRKIETLGVVGFNVRYPVPHNTNTQSSLCVVATDLQSSVLGVCDGCRLYYRRFKNNVNKIYLQLFLWPHFIRTSHKTQSSFIMTTHGEIES
jgi:hypothetical protein